MILLWFLPKIIKVLNSIICKINSKEIHVFDRTFFQKLQYSFIFVISNTKDIEIRRILIFAALKTKDKAKYFCA